jgi:hypothetical protein
MKKALIALSIFAGLALAIAPAPAPAQTTQNVPVVTYRSTYAAGTAYGVGALVFDGSGNAYISRVAPNVGNTPSSSPTQWQPFLGGGGSSFTLTTAAINALSGFTISTSGNAGTATALAATPTSCASGQSPTGVAANGNATGCQAVGGSSFVLTAAEINALGGFTISTSGNAATASALAATPTTCPSGQSPTGVAANGNATGCQTVGGSTGPAGPPATFLGAWNPATAYAVGNAVSYSGSSYVRLIAGTTSSTPVADSTNWGLLAAAGAQGAAGGLTSSGVGNILGVSPASTLLNLYNPATATPSTLVNCTTGATASASSLQTTTGFFPVTPGGTFTLAMGISPDGSGNGVAYYDASFNVVSTGTCAPQFANPQTVTVPSNASIAFAKASFYQYGGNTTVAFPNEMIVTGSTLPSAWSSYGTYPSSTIDAHIATETTRAEAAESLAALYSDVTKAITATQPTVTNLFDANKVTPNTLLQSVGGAPNNLTQSGEDASGYIPVTPGAQYTIAFGDGSANGQAGIQYYDQHQNWLAAGPLYTLQNSSTITVPTTPAGISYMRFSSNYGVTGNLPSYLNGGSRSRATQMVVAGSSLPSAYIPGPQTPFTFASTQTATTGNTSPVSGCRLAVIGDSISAIFSNLWQNEVLRRTGCTLVYQDARGGRTYQGALECYGANPITAPTPGVYSTSNVFYGPGAGTACSATGPAPLPAVGNTLAQNLATTDVLIVALGTNDAASFATIGTGSGTLGTITDASTANTGYGNMMWLIPILHTANPLMKIILVTNDGYIGLVAAGGQTCVGCTNYALAEEAVGSYWSDPVVNLAKTSGINSVTQSTLLGDTTHPTNYAMVHSWASQIAAAVKAAF